MKPGFFNNNKKKKKKKKKKNNRHESIINGFVNISCTWKFMMLHVISYQALLNENTKIQDYV